MTTGEDSEVGVARAAEVHEHRALGLEVLADQLLGTMAAIRRSGRRRAGRPTELSSLTGSQLEVVHLVRRRPMVSINEAAEELRLAPNTVSTLVRQLCQAGLVRRMADDSDRRVVRVVLTETIGRTVAEFRDRRVGVLVAGMQDLSPADQRRMRTAVGVLMKLSWELEGHA